MIKILLFDFDGTIADSFAVVEQVFYEITGHKPISDTAEVDRLRKMHMMQAIKELHIKPWQVPGLVVKGRAAMNRHINEIPIFPGMTQTIRKLHAQGYVLYVMSSNSAQNVHQFLKRHSLDMYFTRVYGNIGLLHKAAAIKNVLRRNRFAPEECVYIGDEARDVDGAKKAGVYMISVSWGYNHESLLQEHKPDALVHEPHEIVSILTEKNKE